MRHRDLTLNHKIENWTFANEAARLALVGALSEDFGKIAYQTDNQTYWRLQDNDPLTWIQAMAGPQGPAGADGADGANGADGVGVPVGGTTGQILAKNSNTDFDTEWIPAPTGGGGGSIVPSDLTGLHAWFKADALGLADGTVVSSWTDSSGNGRHAVQSSGTKQPLFKTAILNGLPAIRFDGSNDLLVTPSNIANGPHTIFIVAQHLSLPATYCPEVGYATVTSDAGGGTDRGFVHAIKSVGTGASYPYQVNGAANYDGIRRYILTRPFFTCLAYEIGDVIPYKNGVAITNLLGPSAYGSDHAALHLGAQVTATTRYSNVEIFEVICYNRVLNAFERLGIDNYLSEKYTI